jgi:DNA-binding phage protein
MTKQVLSDQDVLHLLRNEIRQCGSQMEWARRAGVNRVNLNKILRGHRPVSPNFVKALGLKQRRTDLLKQLRRAIKQARSISALARLTGIDRTHISRVVNGKQPPSEPFFHALKIARTTFYVPEGEEN